MNKRYRCLAEQIYYGEQAGYFIGKKYIFFRVWVKRKGWLKEFATNLVTENVIKLDEIELKNLRTRLRKDKKIKFLLGYPSAFENLANFLDNQGDTPDMYNVKTIITVAESLFENVREKLKKVFGSTVVARYSNLDNCVLAQECNQLVWL